MNVLILTPGRVGSTPLQRVITLQMLHNGFDKPVINFHDLLHGIEKYPNLNTQILRATNQRDFDQSLNEVVGLLEDVDHYKIARIAYYGFLRRNDPASDQQELFHYLNKHFHIIRCERENLLEFALSWIIAKHINTLNVFSANEKDSIYQDVSITVTKKQLYNRLYDYRDFIEWSDENFNIDSHFNYDNDFVDLEEFVSNLSYMPPNSKSWSDIFGMSFNQWNKHHAAESNDQVYKDAHAKINDAVTNGHLPTNISIKLQSFEEKKKLITNFDECVTWFEGWHK